MPAYQLGSWKPWAYQHNEVLLLPGLEQQPNHSTDSSLGKTSEQTSWLNNGIIHTLGRYIPTIPTYVVNVKDLVCLLLFTAKLLDRIWDNWTEQYCACWTRTRTYFNLEMQVARKDSINGKVNLSVLCFFKAEPLKFDTRFRGRTTARFFLVFKIKFLI